MMRKIYFMLKILLWSFVGVFIGSSAYKYYDYKNHPGFYEFQSAPWYLSIEINAAFTAAVIAVILVIMWIVRKKLK